MALSRRSLFAFLGAAALAPAAAKLEPDFGPGRVLCTERMLPMSVGCVPRGAVVTYSRHASALWPGIERWWQDHYDPSAYQELFDG